MYIQYNITVNVHYVGMLQQQAKGIFLKHLLTETALLLFPVFSE